MAEFSVLCSILRTAERYGFNSTARAIHELLQQLFSRFVVCSTQFTASFTREMMAFHRCRCLYYSENILLIYLSYLHISVT